MGSPGSALGISAVAISGASNSGPSNGDPKSGGEEDDEATDPRGSIVTVLRVVLRVGRVKSGSEALVLGEAVPD